MFKNLCKRRIFRFQGSVWKWEPDLVLWVIQLDLLLETLWKWPTAVDTHGTGDSPGSVQATLVWRFAKGQNGRQAACGGPHSWPRRPVERTTWRRAEDLWRISVKAAKSRLEFHFHIQSGTSGRSRGGFAVRSRLLKRDIHAVLKRNRKYSKKFRIWDMYLDTIWVSFYLLYWRCRLISQHWQWIPTVTQFQSDKNKPIEGFLIEGIAAGKSTQATAHRKMASFLESDHVTDKTFWHQCCRFSSSPCCFLCLRYKRPSLTPGIFRDEWPQTPQR